MPTVRLVQLLCPERHCDTLAGPEPEAAEKQAKRLQQALEEGQASFVFVSSRQIGMPVIHCFWCGAYLAGAYTQHTIECWLYGYTKDLTLPDELRAYLRSLRLARGEREGGQK